MADDVNIMKSNKYVPGYDSDSKKVIEPSFVRTQTVVDYDSENFKYGLEYYSSTEPNSSWRADPMFFFQDPLFPTFDIVLDTERSPLFIVDQGFTYKNSLANFLQDYSDINSIGSRIRIHNEFLKTLYTLFNTEFNQLQRNKSYYINSIAGLDTLNKKMIDFGKDKITIVLNEDVSMISSYLAQLYKNLAYSYRDQRYLIPFNLLRFNMYIKISDVRNMYFYSGSGSTMSFDKSYQIYSLKDCNFDFTKSKNFDDTITAGGFGATKPDKTSDLSFDIYFKSVEIETENPLIMISYELGSQNSGTLKLNNKDMDVAAYFEGGLNTVYNNNAKSVDSFNEELTQNSKFNNDGVTEAPMPRSLTNGGLDIKKGTIEDHDKTYQKTSSLIGTNTMRGEAIWDDRTYESQIKDSKTETVYTSDITVETNQDIYTSHVHDLKEVYNMNGNYYNSFKIQDFREKLMRQLNSEFDINRLFQLPALIMSMFFNGLHGFLPGIELRINTDTYPVRSLGNYRDPLTIDTSFNVAPPLDDGDRLVSNRQTEPTITGLEGEVIPGPKWTSFLMKSLEGQTIDTIIPPIERLDGKVIPMIIPPIERLDGEALLITPHPQEPLDGQVIPIIPHPQEPLDGQVIPITPHPQEPLDGQVIPITSHPDERLDGQVIPITPHPQEPLDGQVIPITSHPDERLDGQVIPITSHPDERLDGQVIPITPHPQESLDGQVIPMIIPPIERLDGEIVPFALPPIKGLDGEVVPVATKPPVKGLEGDIVDTTVKNKVTVELGSIDNTLKQKEKFSLINLNGEIKPITPIDKIYLTQDNKIRIFEKMGSLYENKYEERKIDLGIIFGKINKDNVLTAIYLYEKINKFNDLENYKIFNNVSNIVKDLNSLMVDQTFVKKYPFELLYEFDNSVDIKKSLDNVVLYNESKINNILTKINLYDNTATIKPEMKKISLYNSQKVERKIDNVFLYDNITDKKEINFGYIDKKDVIEIPIKLGKVYEQQSIIQKLLVPEHLFKPVQKKEIVLSRIYENKNVIKKFKEIRISGQEKEINRKLLLQDEYAKASNVNETLTKTEKEIDLGKLYKNPIEKNDQSLNNEYINIEKKEKDKLKDERSG